MNWVKQNAGLICCFVWLLSMCVLVHLLNQYKARYQAAEALVESQQVVTANALAAITLFNDISWMATNDKQSVKQAGAERVVYIRQDIKGNTCVDEFVPDTAVDRLREHANSIRASTSGAHSGRTAR